VTGCGLEKTGIRSTAKPGPYLVNHVYTDSVGHRTSHIMEKVEDIPFGSNRQSMKLTTLLHLIPKLRIYVALTVFPLLDIGINALFLDTYFI
jgi:hypothetical protein